MAGQTETILHAIHGRIETGALNPGDVIDEAGLMAEYGVSRTPFREALIRLETAGLVTRQPRKGALVFRPSLDEFLAIQELHATLEGFAAGLAARRISAAGEAALEAATRACEAHLARHGEADPARYYALNLRFHEAVAEAAGNPTLLEDIKTQARKLIAYYRARYAYPGAIAASAREHREIATLIGARDEAAAAEAMRRHVAFDAQTARDVLAAVG